MVQTDSFGCLHDTAFLSVVINVTWTPGNPLGKSSICLGDSTSELYTADIYLGAVYFWHISGGTVVTDDSSDVIEVFWDSAGTGILWYDLESTTIDTVCFNTSDTITVSINPSPSAKAIAGPTRVCGTGMFSTYFVDDSLSLSTYSWSLSTGGIIVGGNGTDSLVVRWDVLGNHQLSVVETNQFGCTGDSAYIFVDVFDKPGIAFVGVAFRFQ